MLRGEGFRLFRLEGIRLSSESGPRAGGGNEMLYITGDTHGNLYKWVEQIDPVLRPGDTILVAGDFGVGFWNSRY